MKAVKLTSGGLYRVRLEEELTPSQWAFHADVRGSRKQYVAVVATDTVAVYALP